MIDNASDVQPFFVIEKALSIQIAEAYLNDIQYELQCNDIGALLSKNIQKDMPKDIKFFKASESGPIYQYELDKLLNKLQCISEKVKDELKYKIRLCLKSFYGSGVPQKLSEEIDHKKLSIDSDPTWMELLKHIISLGGIFDLFTTDRTAKKEFKSFVKDYENKKQSGRAIGNTF